MTYDIRIKQIEKGHYLATSTRLATLKVYGKTIRETLVAAQFSVQNYSREACHTHTVA